MGAVWVRSKPTGLDVGVLTYAFLWFFLSGIGSLTILLPLRRWIRRLSEGLQIPFDGLVRSRILKYLDSLWSGKWMGGVGLGFGDRASCSLSAFAWVGGGGC